jgi:hypothetical protein
MTARLFTLDPVEGFRPKTFAGHRDAVLNAYFSSDSTTVSIKKLPLRILSISLHRSTPSVEMAQCSRGKPKNPI